MRFPFPFIQEA